MGFTFDLASVDQIRSQAQEYFFQHVLSWAMVAQIAATGVALLTSSQSDRGHIGYSSDD